jgi:superfamily II DNA/RNA helicase
MPAIKVSLFFGGLPTKNDENVLKKNCPHIVVGTPGRILALGKSKALYLYYVKHFIIIQLFHLRLFVLVVLVQKV